MTRPPAAVIRVVRSWQAKGRPRQPGILWRRERWLATFPESKHALNSLPNYLDRGIVRAACLHAPSSPAAARHAFLVAVDLPPGGGHRGYAAMVDGSGLMVACWCSQSMGDR